MSCFQNTFCDCSSIWRRHGNVTCVGDALKNSFVETSTIFGWSNHTFIRAALTIVTATIGEDPLLQKVWTLPFLARTISNCVKAFKRLCFLAFASILTYLSAERLKSPPITIDLCPLASRIILSSISYADELKLSRNNKRTGRSQKKAAELAKSYGISGTGSSVPTVR